MDFPCFFNQKLSNTQKTGKRLNNNCKWVRDVVSYKQDAGRSGHHDQKGSSLMKQFTYTITDPVGIHARPAGMLAKAAKALDSTVTITKGEKSAAATKLMAVMGLGVKTGETITFTIEGGDEEASAAAMEQFCKDNM